MKKLLKSKLSAEDCGAVELGQFQGSGFCRKGSGVPQRRNSLAANPMRALSLQPKSVEQNAVSDQADSVADGLAYACSKRCKDFKLPPELQLAFRSSHQECSMQPADRMTWLSCLSNPSNLLSFLTAAPAHFKPQVHCPSPAALVVTALTSSERPVGGACLRPRPDSAPGNAIHGDGFFAVEASL